MVDFRQSIPADVRANITSVDGVVGVGEGIQNGEPAVIVTVTDASLRNDPRIPADVNGMPVYVEVSDRPGLAAADNPLADSGNLPTPVSLGSVAETRPVPAGVSIGHKDVSAGTSSYIAAKDGRTVQLSNSHVLAQYGDASEGDPVLQPGSHDGGAEEDAVGALDGWAPVNGSGNTVDLAWYLPDVDVSTEIRGIGVPDRVGRPEVGDTVKWSGRTSGVSTATVDRVNMSVEVGAERREFTQQFRIDQPLLPGDSGSPIVREEDDGTITAVGLGFAATDAHGYANYTEVVEEQGDLSIITGKHKDGMVDPNPGLTREQTLGLVALLAVAYGAMSGS